MRLCDIRHPCYSDDSQTWEKWRLVYEGGDCFIDAYLKKFRRERASDFCLRKEMTYCPAAASEAVNEIINALAQRLNDVSRKGGSDNYHRAMRGEDGGVDRSGSTMNSFMFKELIPELLTMKKVGVWVDAPSINSPITLAESRDIHPYMYSYGVEDILSWTRDGNRLTSILLKSCDYGVDAETQLPTNSEVITYRYAQLRPEGVYVRTESSQGDKVDERLLNLDRIPFACAEISASLLKNVCNHQIALLQMASSDVFYAVKSNFPFYVEQYDFRANTRNIRPTQPVNSRDTQGNVIPQGQQEEASQGKDDEIQVGTGAGRLYPKDTDQPAFIHPSPEPLRVSMEKQLAIEEAIRRLVHLSVANLDPKMASAESKKMDDKGLQNGLAALGLTLEHLDRSIAEIWAAYENVDSATVRYPEVWTMQSDSDRRAEAKDLAEQMDVVPSKTCQKEIAKEIASKLVGQRTTSETMELIYSEIDDAECVTTKLADLAIEIERGLVTTATASKNRGYPPEEATKALEEQAKRLAIIAIAQSQGAGAARGVPTGPQDQGAANEKTISRAPQGLPDPRTTQRGKGK